MERGEIGRLIDVDDDSVDGEVGRRGVEGEGENERSPDDETLTRRRKER